jgi:hypothetical protein
MTTFFGSVVERARSRYALPIVYVVVTPSQLLPAAA